MKIGDLVEWSLVWLAEASEDNQHMYREEVGIVSAKSEGLWEWFWVVNWSNGRVDEVHRDYLVLLCK
tara:strand:+ start:2353 stop:2553 length:201 start_codon:yes stop_codon:yes gene_type:complete